MRKSRVCFLVALFLVAFCLLNDQKGVAQSVLVYPNNGYIYSYPYVYNYNYSYPVYGYQTWNFPQVVVQEKGCWPFYNRRYYQTVPNQYYMNYSHYYYYPAVVPYSNTYEYIPCYYRY